MRNCLILGSGRSGTSMVAGCLRNSGYFMGDSFYRARDSNPKGFFEDREINRINEKLVASIEPTSRKFGFIRMPEQRLWRGQRWLAELRPPAHIPCEPSLSRRMSRMTAHSPFCFKDPRFCYTLPAWKPFIGDALLICVFREPGQTASSIVRECASNLYLRTVSMSVERALDIWSAMYRSVLRTHREKGDWLFVHYDQVIDGSALPRLEAALGVQVDRDFADARLNRSPHPDVVHEESAAIYGELCMLACY